MFFYTQLFSKQAFKEIGFVTIEDVKNFYQADIIDFHQETFKKVSKLYNDYKARKITEKLKIETKTSSNNFCKSLKDVSKSKGEIKVDEFIRENDL